MSAKSRRSLGGGGTGKQGHFSSYQHQVQPVLVLIAEVPVRDRGNAQAPLEEQVLQHGMWCGKAPERRKPMRRGRQRL